MATQETPIAGYDELPLGTLRHRIRSLTEDEIRVLLDHEQAHADRAPVVDLLRRRLNELEEGAQPSPGGDSDTADTPGHSSSGSPASAPRGPEEPGRPTKHGTGGTTGKGAAHSE